MNNANNSNLILCSSLRLARALRQAEWQKHLASGEQVWHPPQIQPLSTWWSQLFQEAVLSGQTAADEIAITELSPFQERLLWERAIADYLRDEEAAELFNVAGLAQSSSEANQFLIEWNISLTEADATPESTAFMQWRQGFQALCRERGVLESVRFQVKVLQLLQAGACRLPQQIQFAGLERKSPHTLRLIEMLRERHCQVADLRLQEQASQQVQCLALNDQMHECRMAVAWAQQQLGLNGVEPNAPDQTRASKQIAIVVPQLENLRESLVRLLDEALIPYSMRLDAVEQERPYDLSLGLALSSIPIVASALHILSCAIHGQRLLQSDISALLHSPYFSDSRALNARARLDALMREELALSIQPKHWLNYLAKQSQSSKFDGAITQLSNHFTALWQVDLKGRHLPSLWSAKLLQALQAVAWAQGRSLSSHEFQAHKKFLQVLQDLAKLDKVLDKVDAAQILKRLNELCRQDIFQVEAPAQVSLQVVGMLEGFATPLDAIWVMGMNDHQWPPAPRPNPLIAAHLQRQAQTPNADSEVQTQFAEKIQQRLLHSAKQVIFSYALKDGDKDCRISPLILSFATPTSASLAISNISPSLTLPEQWAQQLSDAQRLQYWQWLDDSLAPAIADGSVVSGGTGLLKAQAICPAWAFYRYRLHAKALDEPVNGIDSMQRGELVHAVLENFWRGRDSDYLAALSEQDLNALLQQIASKVMQDFSQQHNQAYPEAFLQLEQQRLVNLTGIWLNQVERKREQKFRVFSVEQSQQQPLRNLSIYIKMDRVDQLEDGRLVLMDYKTGKFISVKSWAKQRIDDPQLPFYCSYVLQDKQVAAVLFAKVWFDEAKFAGVVQEQRLFQKGPYQVGDPNSRNPIPAQQFPDWQKLLDHWRLSLDAIAQEIAQGYAAVIVENEKDLLYCEVKPLLRLAERQLQFEQQQAEAS